MTLRITKSRDAQAPYVKWQGIYTSPIFAHRLQQGMPACTSLLFAWILCSANSSVAFWNLMGLFFLKNIFNLHLIESTDVKPPDLKEM